jgi:hypothetical protein
MQSKTLIYVDLTFKLFKITLRDLFSFTSFFILFSYDLSPIIITFYSTLILMAVVELALVVTSLILFRQDDNKQSASMNSRKKAMLAVLTMTNVTSLMIIVTKLCGLYLNLIPIYYRKRDVFLNSFMTLTDALVYFFFGLYANIHLYYYEFYLVNKPPA